MEQLDGRDRECNLIITGVPEQKPFEGAVKDLGKCRNISAAVGNEGVGLEISWLGKAEENTTALKDAGPSYRRIYVKRDQLPPIRKEWKRLSDVEATEKAKPVNQGCTITLDYKTRQATRDGIMIDKWRPAYFQ